MSKAVKRLSKTISTSGPFIPVLADLIAEYGIHATVTVSIWFKEDARVRVTYLVTGLPRYLSTSDQIEDPFGDVFEWQIPVRLIEFIQVPQDSFTFMKKHHFEETLLFLSSKKYAKLEAPEPKNGSYLIIRGEMCKWPRWLWAERIDFSIGGTCDLSFRKWFDLLASSPE